MKHRYSIEELNCVGIDDVAALVENAHLRRQVSKGSDENQEAYKIYRFILDTRCVSLRTVLDFVFANNLWASWRRGQSTFKDLIKENLISRNADMYEANCSKHSEMWKDLFNE